MKYWLMKSEPSVFGIDDLAAAPKRTSCWDGVRNYQVRNMLRDEFAVGDLDYRRQPNSRSLCHPSGI